jgi:hypothetical protein
MKNYLKSLIYSPLCYYLPGAVTDRTLDYECAIAIKSIQMPHEKSGVHIANLPSIVQIAELTINRP